MAATSETFHIWLKKTLVELNLDEDVLEPYISGILDTDETIDEKEEALVEVLEGMMEAGIEDLCRKILSKWSSFNKDSEITKSKEETNIVDLNEKFSQLITNNAPKVVEAKTYTKEEKAIKDAILAQYGQISDEEDCDGGNVSGVETIGNAEAVALAEREKRDKDKEESSKKKEKDKEDRAKQKSKDEDRKEKEKKRTQKGERRR